MYPAPLAVFFLSVNAMNQNDLNDTPERGDGLYELYILRIRKFNPDTLHEFAIFFSSTFKHYATFQRSIAQLYPAAVLRKIEFGDLTLDPVCRNFLSDR